MAVDRFQREPFRCEVVAERAEARVRPVGELDLATVPLVDAELAELWSVGFTCLVLDLRDVSFLDSTGLRLLFTWHERSAADGVAFRVIRGPREIERVLEVAGVAERLTYVSPDGAEIARSSLRQGRLSTPRR